MATYTYSIFDADPRSGGDAWSSHEQVTIEADSDAEALEDVADALSVEAAGLNPADGYTPGQTIHAIVWRADESIAGQPTYALTADDLGLESESARLERAAKAISATDIGGGRWAHYADETGHWYIVSAEELAELCDYLDHDDPAISRDAYSHWCAGTSAEEQPQGWEPGGAP